MHSSNNRLIGLSLVSLGLVGPVYGVENSVPPQEWLLEQIRVGEATRKDDLIKQSLYRLDLIAPDSPEVLGAHIRQALRQGDQAQAQVLLAELKQNAPQSESYYQAQSAMALLDPGIRERLEQARQLASSGRFAESKALYDKTFNGHFPSLEVTVEYWRVVGRLPNGNAQALQQLQALDKRYPGNVDLRLALARMLYSADREAQSFAGLRQLATEPAGFEPAASLWMEFIKRRDASEQNVADLKEFIQLFSESNLIPEAQAELVRQQKMVADPAYQARMRGLAKIDKGQGAHAIPDLKKALSAAPQDATLIGALGLAYNREGNRQQALNQFNRALALEENEFNKSKWQGLIQTTRYWLALNEGDRAMEANNLTLAQQKYRQAQQLNDGTSGYAMLGIGDVALARKDEVGAERAYLQALRQEPGNSDARRKLVNLYQSQSPQKALAYINQLSPKQRQELRPTLQSLQLDMLKQQGEGLAQQGQWTAAAERYRLAQQLAPEDNWLNYRYAQALRGSGATQQADAVMTALAQRNPTDPEQVYASALYLSTYVGDAQALAHMATLPKREWDNSMQALSQRLTIRKTLDHAEKLRASGNEKAAIAYLQGQPKDLRIDLRLADWAAERGDHRNALAAYQRVLAQDAQNPDAWIGEIEALVAMDRLPEAQQRLVKAPPPLPEADSMNRERRIANAWFAVGNEKQADVIFQRMRPLARQEVSQSSALLLRDAARFERQRQRPALAIEDYRQAMVASGITPTVPKNNEELTRLTRNQPSDDWQKRGIRAEAAGLYRQQDTTVTLDHNYWGSSGTSGVSDLKAHTAMLQLDTPLSDGRAFVRGDFVDMNAGTFGTSNGKHNRNFGTCAEVGCSSDLSQNAQGVSLGVGWENERWGADIGTTPLGFEVTNWVGGVHYNNDWQDISWTATASRRPLSNSLLAFAGTRDPNTGISWGGVVATGASLSASRDRGEADGIWGDVSYQFLEGKNVEDNQRARLMGGYYYKWINEGNRRVSTGISSMLWHYQKDLSGYSLGQGGYYSPQSYFSIGLPVSYRQRTDDWSWELEGSVSWSRSSTKDQRRYPLIGLVPGNLPDRDAIEEGSSNSGVGYTARAIIERRLDPHWSVGAGVDIRQAKDYTPSSALLFVRYSMGGWMGDMDMPPQPLTPYADFK